MWGTPTSFGFVGIDGGGEHYLPFHHPHSDDFFPGVDIATTNWSDILMVCLHNYYRLLFALSFTILCLTTLKFFLPIEIGVC